MNALKNNFRCPDEFVTLARMLADAARPVIGAYYRSDKIAVESKDDLSPVTQADRESELKMRQLLQQHRPQDGIWGEEFGRTQTDAEWQWVLDPLDGTAAFSVGHPTFTTLIGLYHAAHGFVLGIVDQGVVDTRWFGATGHGAWCNKAKLVVQAPVQRAAMRMAVTNPFRLPPRLRKLHDRLQSDVAVSVYGGNALNYVGCADGRLHINIEANQAIYDVAAVIPIIREAGGKITTGSGEDFTLDMAFDGTVLTACCPMLHAQLLKEIA